jgi:hypothetical protein
MPTVRGSEPGEERLTNRNLYIISNHKIVKWLTNPPDKLR